MQDIIETRVCPWNSVEADPAWAGSGIAAYRIWMRQTVHGWWQRHEWERTDGSIQTEEWIKSIPGFSEHMAPVQAEAA